MGESGFETVIGLEIHVQLATRTKLFCGCAPRFGDPPNVHTCPVCLGLPGALPVPNRRAVEFALRAAVALGCRINRRSCFARKNYFYPDLPKGYQISQFDEPIAVGGGLDFDLDGARRSVALVRLHIEEDAGKSSHPEDGPPRSLVDLNRCGTPLIEIVTQPEMRSAEEADAFLTTLRSTLLYLRITDANMEEGSLRCDANVSVRPRGQAELNPKTEIKNLNSFRFLRRALRYEERRQRSLLESGGVLQQSTRLWDERDDRTMSMRSKEEARDYRYFPEPDLVPVVVSEADLRDARERVPELPLARADRYVETLALSREDARALVEARDRAEYFEAVVAAGAEPGAAANWVRGPIRRAVKAGGASIADIAVTPERLAGLLDEVARGVVSGSQAKRVLERMLETGEEAGAIIEAEDLGQVSDADELAPIVAALLEQRPDEVASYRDGKQQLLGFFMGQIMQQTRGKADPKLAEQLLRARLDR